MGLVKTLAMLLAATVLAALESRRVSDDGIDGFGLFVGSARALPVLARPSVRAPRTGLR